MASQMLGQEEFVRIHKVRDQIRTFYQSQLGKTLLAYLSTEREQVLDELLYNSKNSPVFDAELKGKAKIYEAILSLDDFLYSMELKEKDGSVIEPDTRV